MRRHLLFGTFVILVTSGGICQRTASSPDGFVVGVNSFIDVGPPFDFYEVYLVKATDQGSLIEKVNVTPAGDACTQPPKIEFASRHSSSSISQLLRGVDPCAISEKKLHKETKRCKKCLVFSGVNVKMQVQCGDGYRLIKSNVLDKDMFDPAPRTPEYTSWTMGLVGRLGEGFGAGMWDKPIFQVSETKEPESEKPDAAMAADFRAGKDDVLFDGSSEKLSDLYRKAEDSPRYAGSIVRLVTSVPVRPETFPMPAYPPIARAAHVQGDVKVNFSVGPEGESRDIVFAEGAPMLRNATIEAVSHWKFLTAYSGQRVEAKLNFDPNCLAK